MIFIKLLLSFYFIIYYTTLGQVANHGHGYESSSFEVPHKRYEYKFSFKGPYLAQKDGSVPFWHYQGDAIASEDMVRITPSLKSRKGSIWSKSPINFDWWQVELWFRVTGKGRLGADGLAFWFTDIQYGPGEVFGSAENWKGLGIFFDSFDNDGNGNNPLIMAMINDGTKIYDHETDGSQQQLSSCLRDFRNKPYPVRAKIEYYKNILTILFHSGNSLSEDGYETCLRVENVYLPQRGYFGLSAATGGLADDHDVLRFLTYSLHPPGTLITAAPAPGINEKEKEQIGKEFEAYKEKLQKQKEDYLKQHPDQAKRLKEQEDVAESEYETLDQRQLQQIFAGQSQMFEAIKALNRKLDVVVGRVDQAISLIGNVQAGNAIAGQSMPNVQGVPQMLSLPIQRHEVESMLAVHQELIRNTRDMKGLLSQQATSQPASIQQAQTHNQLNQQLFTEIRDSINVLRKEFGVLTAKLHPSVGLQNACPSVNCLNLSYFLFFSIFHILIILGYLIYKNNKDSQAKKFY